MTAVASLTDVPIRPRRPRFDLSDTPLHWIPDDPVATHMMNVLHIMLPPGERWFCDVYREALPLIDDDKLREDVKGFIGQEATHARAHEVGRAYLAGYGIDTERTMRQAEWMRTNLGGPSPFGRTVPRPLRRTWLVARLATIAAIEHFTAVLGEWILTESHQLDTDGADPHMLDLMRWHGAEEVEHRSVAFDVYQYFSGNYLRRLVSMTSSGPSDALQKPVIFRNSATPCEQSQPTYVETSTPRMKDPPRWRWRTWLVRWEWLPVQPVRGNPPKPRLFLQPLRGPRLLPLQVPPQCTE
jgi:predicted metal-dependent hydrolase